MKYLSDEMKAIVEQAYQCNVASLLAANGLC